MKHSPTTAEAMAEAFSDEKFRNAALSFKFTPLMEQAAEPLFSGCDLKKLDIATLAASTPPPLDFVLPGFLAGTVGALVSPGGAGKSMLALQIACHIAGGTNTLGIEAERGRVLYLAAEDPSEVLHHRIHALAGSVGNIDEVAERLDVVPFQGLNMLNSSHRDTIAGRGEGMRIIILDTLRRFHQAEENDGRAMVAVIGAMESIARATGASILFLHHTNKSAALNGMGGEQQASRGSSVLVDNIRWQAFIAGMSQPEAKTLKIEENDRHSYVRFGISKMNYAAPVSDCWYRRAKGGVLVPAQQITERVKLPRADISKAPREKAGWRT